MRTYAASPVLSLVSHSRWPWMVTSRGTVIWKSASHVVFVEGIITPMRLRGLIARRAPLSAAIGAPGSAWRQDYARAAIQPQPSRRLVGRSVWSPTWGELLRANGAHVHPVGLSWPHAAARARISGKEGCMATILLV